MFLNIICNSNKKSILYVLDNSVSLCMITLLFRHTIGVIFRPSSARPSVRPSLYLKNR